MSQSNKLAELEATLEAAANLRKFRRKDFFLPYPKQEEFFDLGASIKERLLMAGNQLGKSEAGAFETACHLTGEYPAWWMGHRFTHPIRAWAAGETGVLVRDVQQKKLMGTPGVLSELGMGYIPKECILDTSLARGVTDAYDTVQIRHKSGGVSTLSFKSYEQGRTKFQGEPVDFIWCDEEPPEDVYSEIVTRTNATKGIVIVTFTPLKGMTGVVLRFLNEPSPTRAVVMMTIEDALHYTPEERQAIIAAYPAHEREARSKGVPMLGSGRIFTVLESQVEEEHLEYIPAHWYKLWAIDFGIGHAFAAILGLWDKDNDVIHLHAAIRIKDQLPIMHAAAMKPIGEMVPVAWPQDGTAREKGTGETVAAGYKKNGLKMLADHATWPDGGVSTEAGILEMNERLQSGRLKVSKLLVQWFEEYRMYHRKDGIIVKINDDLMSATRVLIMAKRFARQVALGGSGGFARRREKVATGVDFDVFG